MTVPEALATPASGTAPALLVLLLVVAIVVREVRRSAGAHPQDVLSRCLVWAVRVLAVASAVLLLLRLVVVLA